HRDAVHAERIAVDCRVQRADRDRPDAVFAPGHGTGALHEVAADLHVGGFGSAHAERDGAIGLHLAGNDGRRGIASSAAGGGRALRKKLAERYRDGDKQGSRHGRIISRAAAAYLSPSTSSFARSAMIRDPGLSGDQSDFGMPSTVIAMAILPDLA